jgi:hypothetical protein
MIISPSQGFVFVHIHKTAGESITEALRPSLGPDDFVAVNGEQPLHKHSKALDIRREIGIEAWQDYFTFTFVRHPVERALSLYRYLAWYAQPEHQPKLSRRVRRQGAIPLDHPSQWAGVQAYSATSSFSEFIRHPLIEDEPGLATQTSSLYDGADRLVKFVGHYETLERDFHHVLQQLHLDDRYLPWRNASKGVDELRLVELPKEDRVLLQQRFAVDFENFGY